MGCGEVASVPSAKEICSNYCEVQAGPDECAFDPCGCRKVGDTCGSTYPAKYGYKPNTLYTCTEKNHVPQKKDACKDTELCVPAAGGNDICGPVDKCVCIGNTPTWSDKFAPSCGFPKDTLINCPDGSSTTPCPEGCAEGECKSGCTCTGNGVKCGSQFSDKCNLLPDSLYACVNRAEPVHLALCDDLACVKGTPDASCEDPCKCKGNHDVSSSVPGFSVDSAYEGCIVF